VQYLISKAETLLEALPYIQRYRSQTFVIKYGGSFMDSPDPAVRDSVARDIVFLEAVGINPVIVHGGGKAITRAMDNAGLQAQFVQGMRVTDAKTIQLVEQVLSHEINPQIVETINSLKGKARGYSGTDIFTCRQLRMKGNDGSPIDPGYVGEVIGVNTAPLRDCIKRSITPVISPTARANDGKIYNCNADVAAAQIAVALKAKRLVFMSDVPGLLRDPQDADSVITHLQHQEIDGLKHSGVIDKGMIPKADSATAALAIRRELLREGQVFWVHNQVETIDAVAERVRELVPGARVAMAHGRMSEDELEKVMVRFWHREFDVLVSTTIIESGLDIPNANTLIVERTDLLGLAQIYQLRGRIGRSARRGYAYLFFPEATLLFLFWPVVPDYHHVETVGDLLALLSPTPYVLGQTVVTILGLWLWMADGMPGYPSTHRQ
jgi:acetylglutamate kinase